MYAKTNPGTGRLSPRQKRVFAIVGALFVLAVIGTSLWAAFGSDKYSGSAHGCVNVTVPSSTGGATLHYCGDAAKSFCQASFRAQDQTSLRARPQCVLAGLAPAASATASG